MANKTYYAILGITLTETGSGIRAAYRDRARHLHPDVGGDASTRAFQDLNEAYEVLSDPVRRRAYDATLGAAAPPRTAISILAHPETIHPSFEEVYDRFQRNFTGLHVPKAERLEAFDVDVLLTHDEAAAGCMVAVAVPAFRRCSRCGGSGFEWSYPCAACGRSGVLEAERLVQVRVPPMMVPGSIYEVPLGGLGIHNFHLRLHMFVEP